MKRRAVITGMGAVTPIGVGVDEYWDGLLTGRSGVGPISLFDASPYPTRIAAEVDDFRSADFFDRKVARLLSRGGQFAVASSLLCLNDANWSEDSGDGPLGVYCGTSNSAQDVVESQIDVLLQHGYRRVLPHVLTKSFPHSAASETGRLTGFQSQVMTFATACTAGLVAVGYAAEEIRSGRSSALLCCATDSTIAKYVFAGFCRSGILSTCNDDPTRASRPFDARRDGGVLGEGAGCVLLEEAEHARRRGVVPLAEVLGFGCSGSGYSDEPDQRVPQGMREAMQQAMLVANCGPAAIDFIGCHGVSDVSLDAWETQAIKQAFGERAYSVPISSVKSLIGIPQCAAGMLQLVATVKAMGEGILPPTANYEFPDPSCDLDYVPNVPRRNRIERAMVLAHGFNGSDAALVIGRPGRL